MKFRIISLLTGAIRIARTTPSRADRPYSLVMPLPPWVWIAASNAFQAASAAAYLAMLDASPAAIASPRSCRSAAL